MLQPLVLGRGNPAPALEPTLQPLAMSLQAMLCRHRTRMGSCLPVLAVAAAAPASAAAIRSPADRQALVLFLLLVLAVLLARLLRLRPLGKLVHRRRRSPQPRLTLRGWQHTAMATALLSKEQTHWQAAAMPLAAVEVETSPLQTLLRRLRV